MCEWVPGAEKSPDRVDALVWALTELSIMPSSPIYEPETNEFLGVGYTYSNSDGVYSGELDKWNVFDERIGNYRFRKFVM